MESEHHYELRNRSRSRSHTPMIFNQLLTESESEHHYDLRSRESRERSTTPAEVSSSRRSGSRSLPGSAQKSKEKAMEAITERQEEAQAEFVTEKDRSTPPTVKKSERRSERQRAKRQLMTNGQGEAKERQSVERTEHKRNSVTPKRTITSDYSSEEGEREDPPSRPASAYEIYKQAGDYWNVFPKTDYTYSPTSQCRYEIAPGVLAMPNMSRPSIHSDGSSAGSTHSISQQTNSQTSLNTRERHTDSLDGEINESIEQNRLNEENARFFSSTMSNPSSIGYKQVHVEHFTHRRIVYEDTGTNINKYDRLTQVDSDAELDEAITRKTVRQSESFRVRKWYESIKRIVAVLIVSVVEFTRVKILRREEGHNNTSQGYYRYEVSESRWEKLWSKVDHYLQYLYLWLIRVLYLDSWILSRFSKPRERILGRPSRLLWLILLPPLLLAGCWLLPNARNLTLPSFNSDAKEDVTVEATTHHETKADKGIVSDELKKSIEILINRVEKLEAAGYNHGAQILNITESINAHKFNEKTVWAHYNEKLSNFESKLADNSADEHMHKELHNIKSEFKNLQDLYAQKKPCCDQNPELISNSIEKRVEKVVTSYFGTGAFKSSVAKIVEDSIKENPSILLSTEAQTTDKTVDCPPSSEVRLSDHYIQNIVKEVLKIYDADKTGRVDYALESAGGQIISIRCTQRYNVNTRAFKVLGFTLFYESGDPRTVIQGHQLQPGVCWAFQDFPGYLLIKLRSPIRVTGFTMEHAPRSILPNNEMKSAPRKFNVWGLREENDAAPLLFGEYEFLDNDDSLQYFPVNNDEVDGADGAFEFVELRIHSNHGQLEYTCLYRFRIHGIPV